MGVGQHHNRHSQHSHWQVHLSPILRLLHNFLLSLSPSKRKREPVSLLSSLGLAKGARTYR